MTLSLVPQIEWTDRPAEKITLNTRSSDPKILHAIPGRIRIGIPLLSEDKVYGERLENALRSLSFVTQVRNNLPARSIVIHYTNNSRQEEAIWQSILATIRDINPPVLPTITEEELEPNLTHLQDGLTRELKTLLSGKMKNFSLSLGVISLIVGVFGFLLPLVPGTPFLVLASWFFSLAEENAG